MLEELSPILQLTKLAHVYSAHFGGLIRIRLASASIAESFFFRARTVAALSATIQKWNAARQVTLLLKPDGRISVATDFHCKDLSRQFGCFRAQQLAEIFSTVPGC
jgi:hypothetical protein